MAVDTKAQRGMIRLCVRDAERINRFAIKSRKHMGRHFLCWPALAANGQIFRCRNRQALVLGDLRGILPKVIRHPRERA